MISFAREVGASDRVFEPEDCCGLKIETPDGTIPERIQVLAPAEPFVLQRLQS
jgi:hypothetical protein